MSLILSIETATPVSSVALHSNGEIMAHSHLFINQAASSKLTVMIDELLKRCELLPNQLNAIAVSAGPGSYTGLRIGVATAKGMCYALSKPLIAVNTLLCMARQIAASYRKGEYFCPMLDARRMEVYCMMINDKGDVVEDTEARIIDPSSFQSSLEENEVVFFGNGAEKCKAVIVHKNAIFLNDVHPSAQQIGELAYEKFQREEFENVAEFEPFYLKDFLVKKPKSSV